MPAPYIFNPDEIPWTDDARFPGIGFQLIQSKTTHPHASVVRVRVDPGGVINTHTHPIETETAYVLSGQGTLTAEDQEYVLTAGMSVTILPGTPHSMRNSGDVPLEMVAMHTPGTR